MINYKINIILGILIALISSCSQTKDSSSFSQTEDSFFFVSKLEGNISVYYVAIDQMAKFDQDSCLCVVEFEKAIRISKQKPTSLAISLAIVREYYGENLFSVGEIVNGKKSGLWTTFCNDKKIANETWQKNILINYTFYDKRGNITLFNNRGDPAEDF